jgi:lipopolysaccharide export LptBFGC system permease protein LptF
MKILDRYVVRSFLTSALLWFVVMMSLRIVVDLFVNMDEFAKLNKPFQELAHDIFTYYGYQSLVYFIELGGVIIVAAATFSLAMMNHTNELTAMLASGVSMQRVVVPLLFCAALLGGLVVIDQEYLIPPSSDKLARSQDDVPGVANFPIRLMRDGQNSIWFSKDFRPKEGVAEHPVVVVRQDEEHGSRHIATVFGEKGYPATLGDNHGWIIEGAALSSQGDRGAPWPHLQDCKRIYSTTGSQAFRDKAREIALTLGQKADQINSADYPLEVADESYGLRLKAEQFQGDRLMNPRFEFTQNSTSLGVFVAQEAVWHEEKNGSGYWELTGGRLFYPSDLTVEDLVLRQSGRWLSYMSTSDLSALLKLKRVPDPTGAILAKYIRFADPINNIVMLLLGVPFILSRERNIKSSASLCLLMVGTFYVFIYLCRYIGLSPSLAAALPPILFGSVAVVMLDSVKT